MSAAAYHLRGDALSGPIVWTCEHASGAIPVEWSVEEADARWFSTHWGYDRGARELVVALQERLGGPAIFGAHSRLIADLNRPPDHPDLCRKVVDGVALELNREVSEAERAARVRDFYRPYHDALTALLAARAAAGVPTFCFSVHTFTPLYEGQPRTLDAGVLHDESDTGAAAVMLAALKRSPGVKVALNEPWSGMKGLMYSVAHHSARHGFSCLEIEVRDDHLVGPDPAHWAEPVPVKQAGVDAWADRLAQGLQDILAGK